MAENPLAPFVAAGAVDGAPPMGAAGAGAPPPPAVAEDPIHGVLRTCGVAAQASRMTFINIEGLVDSIAAFAMMSGDNCMATMPTAAGRVILGTMQINRIQALVHWIKDYDSKRGLVPEPDVWTGDTMMEAMDERKEAEQNYGKIDVDIIDPGKCQTNHGWDNWQIAFVNKLNATMGAASVPVKYVVRPDVNEDDYLFFND